MSTVATWGLCPSEVEITPTAPSVFSTRDEGFLAGRLYSSRVPRLFVLKFEDVPPVWWDDTMQIYRASFGGALRVAYTPNGEQATEVRFADRPQAMTKDSAASISFQVVFEEVRV